MCNIIFINIDYYVIYFRYLVVIIIVLTLINSTAGWYNIIKVVSCVASAVLLKSKNEKTKYIVYLSKINAVNKVTITCRVKNMSVSVLIRSF